MATPRIYFKYPFGVDGNLTPISDPTVSGLISYQQGYPINYEGDLATDPQAQPIDRPTTNQLFYDITSAIQLIQQQGVASFITAAANDMVAYDYVANALAWYDAGSGGQIWESQVNSNTSVPGADANWAPVSKMNTRIQQAAMFYAVDTGSAGAIAVAPSPAYPTLTDGMILQVNVAHTNTGALTIAVNGGSSHPVNKIGSTGIGACVGYECIAGFTYQFSYNAALTAWLLIGQVKPNIVAYLNLTGFQPCPVGLTKLVLNNAVFDPFSIGNTSTGTITLPIPGYWRVTGSTGFAPAAVPSTGHTGGQIYINGAANIYRFLVPGSTVDAGVLNGSFIINASGTATTVELYADQTTGGTINYGPNASELDTSLMVEYLGN